MHKRFSKAPAVLILLMLSLQLVPIASAATLRDKVTEKFTAATPVFSDIAGDHANFIAIAFLNAQNIIKGYEDGTFKPDNAVNRAELVKMAVGMMMGEPDAANIAKYNNCFPDVKDEWFAAYICIAKEQGWIDGYPDGTFKPGNLVNRVEAIKIVLNAMIAGDLLPAPTEAEKNLLLPSDADPTAWYKSYLKFAIAKKLLDDQHVIGSETEWWYMPGDPMTRKEVAEMIFRTNLYMGERVEYGGLMANMGCLANSYSSTMEQTQMKEQLVIDYLTPNGYTAEDVSKLKLSYGTDEVVDAYSTDLVEFTCGDKTKVDMDKWDRLTMYGVK
jgi:hypothetical protein